MLMPRHHAADIDIKIRRVDDFITLAIADIDAAAAIRQLLALPYVAATLMLLADDADARLLLPLCHMQKYDAAADATICQRRC